VNSSDERKREKSEINDLACKGCGKIGVSICAKCAKTGYRRAIARANPLRERDPEFYKQLDEMSRLSLQGNQQSWDEFCIEIKAEHFYEHLPILVEILHEGKWRTDALDAKKWLRENLAKRVKRVSPPEDYGPNGKRLPGGPKFDKRNGALTAFATRPYAEFEVLTRDGDTISPDEAIEGQIERRRLQMASGDEDDNCVVMPADRESLRLLGRKTLAEWVEEDRCVWHLEMLQRNRPVFDAFLAQTISEQQVSAKCVGLDLDEAEALAVMTLLSATGPRAYLNHLDTANRRRLRNAFDRLHRKLEKSDWVAFFRKTLREQARKRRDFSSAEKLPPRVLPSKTSPRKLGSRGAFGLPAELTLRWHTQVDRTKGLLFPTSKETPTTSDSDEAARPVDLGCDLTAKQRVLYRSSAGKPKPSRESRLYSE
jgi:hypothetical protein